MWSFRSLSETIAGWLSSTRPTSTATTNTVHGENGGTTTTVQDPYDHTERGADHIPLEVLSPVASVNPAEAPRVVHNDSAHASSTNTTQPGASAFASSPFAVVASFVGFPTLPPAYGEHTRDTPLPTPAPNFPPAGNANTAISSGSWYDRLLDRFRNGVNITTLSPLGAPPFIMAIPGWFLTDESDNGGGDTGYNRPRRLGWLTGRWRTAWIVFGSALLISLPLTITLTMESDMSDARSHARQYADGRILSTGQ